MAHNHNHDHNHDHDSDEYIEDTDLKADFESFEL